MQDTKRIPNKTNSGGMALILNYEIKMPSKVEFVTEKVTSTKLTNSCYDFNSNNAQDFRRRGIFL